MIYAKIHYRSFKRNLAPLFSLILILCYYPPAQATEEQSIWLDVGQEHESCHALSAGEVLSYQFSGSSVTLFNIHYHQGEEISYPVAEELAFKRKRSLIATSSQSYCLMWRNARSQPLTLLYQVSLPAD